MKKILFIALTFLLLLGGQATLFAQKNKVMNLQNYDNKWLHFGFLLGFNSANFRIVNQPDFAGYDSLDYIQTFPEGGFNLGIISNLHLGEYFDFRFIPTLSFSSRKIEYVYTSPKQGLQVRTKDVESTFLDFPLLMKYKSARHNNFRAYLVGGIRYTFDMASQKDVKEEPGMALVKINDQDYGLELGVGFDFYLNYFKFSPEIRYYFGLKNMIVQSNTIFSKPIDRLTSKIILISFNFE